ncbi:uncharacterized protein LOC143821444 isoform X1 [Paroedura picta]|uniref:uncharacterized protein LOC143821444 isoform X1 n=1 Tax=Paroedura picta TaxID=143630 RepID=UPI004057A8AB
MNEAADALSRSLGAKFRVLVPEANPKPDVFAEMEPWRRVILQGITGSLAPSTQKAYEAAVRGYNQFITRLGRRNCWPIREDLLLCYLAHLWQAGRSPTSMRVTLAGLSLYSKVLGMWDPGSSFLAKRAIKGWKRVKPNLADTRRPVTRDILKGLLAKLPEICYTKFEVALASAAFCLAYYGAFRCSELLAPSRSSMGHAALGIEDITSGREGLWVRLHQSKIDQGGKGATIFLPHLKTSSLCLVQWVDRYLLQRPPVPGPLLIHENGLCFSRFQFGALMRRCLANLGLCPEHFGSHSFRIGVATQKSSPCLRSRLELRTLWPLGGCFPVEKHMA